MQYFTNGFSSQTKGIDLVTTYMFHVGPGTLGTTLAFNYNKTDVTSFDPNAISTSRISDIQHYAPNNRVNLNVDYHSAPFIASVHENYYDSFRDDNDCPGQLFSAKFPTDLDLAYAVTEKIAAAIGGRNILSAYSDRIAQSASTTVYPQTGGLVDREVYPGTGGPFGFNGAFSYARIDAKV